MTRKGALTPSSGGFVKNIVYDGKEERKNRDVRKKGREKKGVMGEEEGNEEGRKGTGLWK